MNLQHFAGVARSEPLCFRSRRLIAPIASCAIGLGAALAFTGNALAQSSGGPYTLHPQSIAGGGGRSSGAVFVLEGTIGQHAASNVQSGGVFELTGGFHQRSQGPLANAIFSNGFEGP